MEKELIRREFFKLKLKGFPYTKCRAILRSKYHYDVTTRTLKRWIRRLDEGDWDFRDESRRPHTIHHKITPEIEEAVIKLRQLTGWGQAKLFPYLRHLGISERSVKRILKEHGLSRPTGTRGKRIKWVRWQRKHPNSLWQIDHTDEQMAGCYTLSVLDDCSRYSLALVSMSRVTTRGVTNVLDELIRGHGTPREILTDNGSAYGQKSTRSKFDRWCRMKRIRHIRTKIHSPTTNGKVERLFRTMDEELPFCAYDLELFRMRYNFSRPHSSLHGKCPADIYYDFASLF